MKKKFSVLITIAVMLLVTSCENKVDCLLNKYEEAVDEYVEVVHNQDEGDILGGLASDAKLAIKISDIESNLSKCEGEMSEEQVARMNEIREKLIEVSIESSSIMIDDAIDSSGDIDNAVEDIAESMDDAFDMLDDEW